MSAQPANTSIKVYRTVRSYRQQHRHESVAALCKKLRPLVMSVPGEEVMVGALSRDTTTKDLSPYMGEARHNATRGFPIVVGLLPVTTFAAAVAALADIDFPYQVGSDYFIANTADGLDNDLHQNLRDV